MPTSGSRLAPRKVRAMKLTCVGSGLAIVACCLAVADSVGAASSCGEIAREGESGVELVSTRATGTSCSSARSVLSDQLAARTRGWSCSSAGSEAMCTKGRARASYLGASGVGSCGFVSFEANNDNVAASIQARGTSCKTARAVARGSRAAGRYRARGYRCASRSLEGGLPASLYTCRNGRATVAFRRT